MVGSPLSICPHEMLGITQSTLDFTFDDEFNKLTSCNIHSYDPSMGVKSNQRSPTKYFYNMGIADVTQTNWDGRGSSANAAHALGWNVTTLDDEMKRLGVERAEVVKMGTYFAVVIVFCHECSLDCFLIT